MPIVAGGKDSQTGRTEFRGSGHYDQPLVEAPIIEYEGNRVYIELRHTPEDDLGGCALNLPMVFKKITFRRDLDELAIFDSSTDPPERRWPIERRRPSE